MACQMERTFIMLNEHIECNMNPLVVGFFNDKYILN